MWFSSFLVWQRLVYQIPVQQRWFGKVRFIKARTPPLGSYPRQARARAPSSLGRSARQEIALLVSKNGCSRCQRSNYRRARRRRRSQQLMSVRQVRNAMSRRGARRGGAGQASAPLMKLVALSLSSAHARALKSGLSVGRGARRPRSTPMNICDA